LGASVSLSVCLPSWAQLDTPGPEHLVRVEGIVVNSEGKPLVNAVVMLTRDGNAMYTSHTDQRGEFSFRHVSGQFVFKVARTEYAPAAREIIVTDELITRAERKKLYVIVGPGACADECSSVLTNKQQFDKAIREKNRR
jgi:ribosomal protein S11